MPPRLEIEVNGRPPKKRTATSCWSNETFAPLLLHLRSKLLEGKKRLGLTDCFRCPVRLELSVFAPNVMDTTHDYVGDLDSLVAGVFEALQQAPSNPDIKIHPIFLAQEFAQIGPTVPLIVENDAIVVEVIARKIRHAEEHYKVVIEPLNQ